MGLLGKRLRQPINFNVRKTDVNDSFFRCGAIGDEPHAVAKMKPDWQDLYFCGEARGQSSVRKGEAGSPSALKRLQSGLSAHANRTPTGAGAASLETITSLPSISAFAQWNFRSDPAM